jgi:alpha-beta hydrolase superfamily lysophospholipase
MLKLLTFLAIAYLSVVVGMTLFQRKLMYFPHTDMQAPAAYGLEAYVADEMTTEDNVKLTYWYAAPAKGKPTILYLHGNGGHLGFRSEFYQHAHQMGYGVFALSYRGFGTSQGMPSEQGLYADARTAIKTLNEQYRTPDADIIVYGESIGTGVAMEMAQSHTFRIVALQAPFTSARNRAEQLYFWLPVRWIMWDVYDSLAKASKITSPVLVFIGAADELILPEDSMQLYKAIPTRKHVVKFAGISHNAFEPVATLKALSDFESNQR